MYGKDLIDKEVVGNNGWKIGKSKDIVVDSRNWQVSHIDVELKSNIEDELGMGYAPMSHNRLPIPMTYFQGVGDVITLKASKEEIVAALGSRQKTQQANPASSNTTPVNNPSWDATNRTPTPVS